MYITNLKLESNKNFNTKNNQESKEKSFIAQISHLSDSKLYEIASNYITTDESLENFKRNKLKSKNKNFYSAEYNSSSRIYFDYQDAKSKVNNNICDSEKVNVRKHERKISNNLSMERLGNRSCKSSKRTDSLGRYISNNLEYYKFIE
jgi:hypothetical protein